MPRPCQALHALDPAGCHLCRWWVTPGPRARKVRAAWAPAAPCRHLGAPTGDLAECPSCGGAPGGARTRLKVHSCELHGRCVAGGAAPGLASCATCDDRDPLPGEDGGGAVFVNHDGGGIGDALLGLAPLRALKAQDPGRPLVYACAPGAVPWAALFEAGYDHLAPGVPAARSEAPLQLNAGHERHERDGAGPRWQRYAKNAGVRACSLPSVRDPGRLRALGAAYSGAVLLSPFSVWPDREYPLPLWLEADRLLRGAGHRTVVLDDRAGRCGGFPGEKLLGRPPAEVAGAVLCAAFLAGNDSGLCHLAGCLGTPAVALCGPTWGEYVFGLYPSARWVQAPGGRLDAIGPRAVLDAADAVCLPALAGGRSLLGADKLAVLRDCVLATNHLPGALAEVGTYRGGSAKVMGRFAPDATLWLFDTFLGMPEGDEHPGGAHGRGDFADTSLPEVTAFIGNPRAVCVPGRFPGSAPLEVRYRFAHLDADLLQVTRDGLRYLWPRMSPGGILLVDDLDWPRCPGVRQALGEVLPGVHVERPTPHQGVLRKGG